jgi:hypothetical protein
MPMPFSVRIEPGTGTALVACSGVLGAGEAREGAAAVWTAPGWNGRSVVFDMRSAHFEVSTEQIRAIAGFILENQPSPPARVAFVTGRDLEFGLARMYEAFRDHPSTRVRVFRDRDAAVAWAQAAGADGP